MRAKNKNPARAEFFFRARFLRHFFRLSACALCRAPFARRGLCENCKADILALRRRSRCPQCAADSAAGALCGECLRRPPFFDATVSALPFAFPVDILLREFKYRGGWQLAPALAAFLPQPPKCDVAVPVPLHPNREKRRGFNQSRELLRAWIKSNSQTHGDGDDDGGGDGCDGSRDARRIIAVREDILKRTADTPRQSLMPNAAARQKNVRGVFAAKPLQGLSVLVTDDVMTSGATLNEIAKTLKKAGAAQVTNLVAART